MNIVYAFIGNLPPYSIDTVHQTRLFFDGPIYFIVSQMDSPFLSILKDKYNVIIIPYTEVKNESFTTLVQNTNRISKDCWWIQNRPNLFIHSFERFFVLENLMKKYTLTDVLFLELDNLIYDTPQKWLSAFQKKPMSVMYFNNDHLSAGICYVQSSNIVSMFTAYCMQFIQTDPGFISEMGALYKFWELHRDYVMLLPTHWATGQYIPEIWETFPLFNSIFDALALGIFLGGVDPTHTRGVFKKGFKWEPATVDYTPYTYDWIVEDGKRIPYVLSPDSGWLRINNLHVHSKVLGPMLSVPMA